MSFLHHSIDHIAMNHLKYERPLAVAISLCRISGDLPMDASANQESSDESFFTSYQIAV